MGNKGSIKRKKYNKKTNNINRRKRFKNKGGGPLAAPAVAIDREGLEQPHRVLLNYGDGTTQGLDSANPSASRRRISSAKVSKYEKNDFCGLRCPSFVHDSCRSVGLHEKCCPQELTPPPITPAAVLSSNVSGCLATQLENIKNKSKINITALAPIFHEVIMRQFKGFKNDLDAERSFPYMLLEAGAAAEQRNISETGIDRGTLNTIDSVIRSSVAANATQTLPGMKSSSAPAVMPNPWMKIIIMFLFAQMIIVGVDNIQRMRQIMTNSKTARELMAMGQDHRWWQLPTAAVGDAGTATAIANCEGGRAYPMTHESVVASATLAPPQVEMPPMRTADESCVRRRTLKSRSDMSD